MLDHLPAGASFVLGFRGVNKTVDRWSHKTCESVMSFWEGGLEMLVYHPRISDAIFSHPKFE